MLCQCRCLRNDNQHHFQELYKLFTFSSSRAIFGLLFYQHTLWRTTYVETNRIIWEFRIGGCSPKARCMLWGRPTFSSPLLGLHSVLQFPGGVTLDQRPHPSWSTRCHNQWEDWLLFSSRWVILKTTDIVKDPLRTSYTNKPRVHLNWRHYQN